MFLACAIIFAVVFPMILLVIWRRKTHTPLLPALLGAVCFVVFALGLETIPKYPLFIMENDVSAYIATHTWAYVLAGTLLAGIFEETGRFVMFSLMKKKYNEKPVSVMFGIGHGGIECMILLGISALQFIAYAAMIQNGTFDSLLSQIPANVLDAEAQLAAVKEQVLTLTGGSVLLMMWERVTAVTVHIAFSVMVFIAVQRREKRYFYPLAMLLHALFDVTPALYQCSVVPLLVCEIVITVMAAALVPVAIRMYRNDVSLTR